MDDVKRVLKREYQKYHELEKKLEINAQRETKSWLKINTSKKGYVQYVLFDEAHPKGKYLRKDEFDVARQLAQQTYERKAYEKVHRRAKLLEKLLKEYETANIRELYEGETFQRQQLIVPVEMPDDEFVKAWLESETGNANAYPMEYAFETDNDETVRSKSEKIIADRLKSMGIPYIYEPRIEIKTGSLDAIKVLYPDFKALNVRLRKSYYYEHFGMMGNPEYAKRAMEKIAIYEKNGFFFGENLLYTFESDSMPFDGKILNILINKYLK